MPILTESELDVPLDFDSVMKAGSMLGSAGCIVAHDSRSMVALARNLSAFYKHESCGKCSPCREGTGWLYRMLVRIESGQGEEKDLDTLKDVCDSIAGRTLCAFGDAAITPVLSSMEKFRDEYEYYIQIQKNADLQKRLLTMNPMRQLTLERELQETSVWSQLQRILCSSEFFRPLAQESSRSPRTTTACVPKLWRRLSKKSKRTGSLNAFASFMS